MKAPTPSQRFGAGEDSGATHYRVTVKELFYAYNELFRPGDLYTVTAAIFNSDVDGKSFADRCETAEPEVRS